MRTFNLSPGDCVSVERINGETYELFLEDGPYTTKEGPCITLADDCGNITSATWVEEELKWIEND